MYSIGDKVVYPMYGAGIIESIEEQELSGQVGKYYVMRMPMGELKVMIPLENAARIGIRGIIDSAVADKVLADFAALDTECELSWNKRYRENMLKIKSGDVFEVARVVKMLMMRDYTKGLSTGEKKMLTNARQILVSELVLAKNMTEEEIGHIFEEALKAEC